MKWRSVAMKLPLIALAPPEVPDVCRQWLGTAVALHTGGGVKAAA